MNDHTRLDLRSHPDERAVVPVGSFAVSKTGGIVKRCVCVIPASLLLLLAGCRPSTDLFSSSEAGKPIPQVATARTHRDMMAAQEAYCRATILEPYLQHGRRNVPWDAQAVAFLDAFVDFASGGLAASVSGDRMVADSHALLKSGCDDPMVLACCGRILRIEDPATFPAAWPVLEKGVEAFDRYPYPALRGAMTPRDLARSKHPQAERYARIAADRYIRSMGETQYIKGHEEAWLEIVFDVFSYDPLIPFCDAIYAAATNNTQLDPWAVGVLSGAYHFGKAWAARGGGYANTVTEEGWREFQVHMPQACSALTLAWQQRPSAPLISDRMITVTVNQYGNPGDTPRLWFDRCAAAQLDYVNAYHGLMSGLQPRWGGTHEDIYAFGLACLKTRRYDTLTPVMFLEALQEISQDVGDDSWWQKAGVYRKIKDMIAGYRADPKCPLRENWLTSLELAMEWFYGDVAVVDRLRTDLGPKLEQDPFHRYFYSWAVPPGGQRPIAAEGNRRPLTPAPRSNFPAPPSPSVSPASPAPPSAVPAAASPPVRMEPEALVGKKLTEVKDLRGTPSGRVTFRGVTYWKYSDCEIVSDDGVTVSKVVAK